MTVDLLTWNERLQNTIILLKAAKPVKNINKMSHTENSPQLNNLPQSGSLLDGTNNSLKTNMKNADRPFLLIILIAISLLYTIMAFLS